MVSVWAGDMVDQGVSMVWAVAGLRLPQGGVAQHWAGEPTSWYTSIGEASVGGIAAATTADRLGAEVVGIAVSSWEAGEGSISIGVEDVALVHLEAGGLTVVGGGPRKGKKLPSFLEGPAFFWPQAMVEKRVLPGKL